MAILLLDSILGENLQNGQAAIVLDSTAAVISDVTIRNIAEADTVGTTYILKNTGTHTVGVLMDMPVQGNIGSGLVDPASTSAGITGLVCIGTNCKDIHTTALAVTQGLIEIPAHSRTFFVNQTVDTAHPAIAVGGGLAGRLITKSSNYTLTYADNWVNVTGTTTITVPHAAAETGLPNSQWRVFNSGSNTVTLQCDSGNMNGAASITLAANTGKTVTSDGTNCFAL
jgi:hypothetical protein